MNKPVSELSLDEIMRHARGVDDEKRNADEAARLEKLGIRKEKREWNEQDHAATRERVAAEEARRKAAAELPDARGLSDAEVDAALARQGIFINRGLM